MSQITQRGATGALALQAGGSFQQSTDVNLSTLIGSRYDTSDGREVILVGCGATSIGSNGVLCQDSPTVTNHQGLVVTAVQAYSANGNIPATVTVTLGATALAANAYQGGFLVVNSLPGAGQALRIASHLAGGSGSTGVIVTLEDAPNTALTTASTVSLIPAHGSSVVICPTTITGALAGVTLYPLTAGSYGFLLSKGLGAAISDASAPGIGLALGPSATIAGTVRTFGGSSAVIGYAAYAATSGSAAQVFVNL